MRPKVKDFHIEIEEPDVHLHTFYSISGTKLTSNARLCDSLNPRLNISLHRQLCITADILQKVASGICTWLCASVNINVHICVGVHNATDIVVILLAIKFVHLICYSINNTQKKST